MTVYGYARVSTDGQTLAAQDGQLHAAGCAKVFSEKVSGVKTDRAALGKLLKRLEPGDVLVVTRLDRLARSTRDLLNILDTIAKAGAGLARSIYAAIASSSVRSPSSRAPNGGVIVTAGPAANVHRERINALVTRHRLPAVYPFRYYAESGGLIAYGPDIISQCRPA